jgi:hypothetical protein
LYAAVSVLSETKALLSGLFSFFLYPTFVVTPRRVSDSSYASVSFIFGQSLDGGIAFSCEN